MRNDCASQARKWQVTTLLRGYFALLPALVLVTAFLPSAVRAECGDYVIRGGGGLSTPASPAAMMPARSGQHEQQLPMEHGLPHKPCRGPNCSQQTPSPSLPPTTVSPTAEQWGCVIALPFVRDFLSTCQIVEVSSHLPRLFGQGIYHPPRFLSSLRSSC